MSFDGNQVHSTYNESPGLTGNNTSASTTVRTLQWRRKEQILYPAFGVFVRMEPSELMPLGPVSFSIQSFGKISHMVKIREVVENARVA